ncbi:MAG: tetratricopeptide repeat protein [Verrucomicrobia bacterium]|nr:tetratricopeptide repeat protein [Verrucomicrobiota bacterium]
MISCAVLLAACTPPGPRALLKGEKLLKEGHAKAALDEFKDAVTHLPQNAQAWNHLGLAHHAVGQPAEAARAYRQALALDPNIIVAHFNLGCLLLESGQAAPAVNELASFTLQNPKSLDGWLKRGSAELHARQFDAAEQSFRRATNLNPRLPDALNGLGVAQLYRNRARDAFQTLYTANQAAPAYAPAALNLAVVTHQYIAARQPEYRSLALQKYREFAAIPGAPNRDAVQSVIQALEEQLNPPPKVILNKPPAPSPQTNSAAVKSSPPVVTKAETNNVPPKASPPVTMVAVASPAKIEPAAEVTRPGELPPFKPVIEPLPAAPRPVSPQPVQAATVTPLTTPATSPKPDTSATSKPALPPFGTPPGTAPSETPLPETKSARPAPAVEAAPVNIARYSYRNPSKPAPGNRFAAESFYAQGEELKLRGRWADALAAYEQAARTDPAFFEAQHNVGAMANQVNQMPRALLAYETALALQPASLSARFNFALCLENAGYYRDAANELERLLTDYPDEARAHLALANLYAKRLMLLNSARDHYVRVIQLDPQHPQGTDIRFWLRDHPQ